MLSEFTTGFRFRLAIALALFAAVCFTLPPAVLAMGHGANTVACLSHADKVNHGMAKAGHAAHGAVHDAALPKDESDHAPPSGDHQMTCCGLFCLSAMPTTGNPGVYRAALGVPRTPLQAPRLISSIPELPERPPNTLLYV